MYYDTMIIGGGASGLCTAIKSKKNNNSVLLIEHNQRVGKKILATGNGKCNLTNAYCRIGLLEKNDEGIYPYFPVSNREFIAEVISSFDNEDALKWFESIGLFHTEKNGYYYPLSEQASSVLDALRYAAIINGVDIITDHQPVEIINKDGLFIADNEYRSRNLVLACGGMAASKFGTDGSGYEYASSFGHNVIKPRPALCGFKAAGRYFKELKGVRCNAILNLTDKNKKEIILTSKGNVQFNDYGISGIPAMQLSSLAGKLLEEGKELQINIVFVPEIDFIALVKIIADELRSLSVESMRGIPLGMLLNGILNKKIISVILKETGLNYDMNIKDAIDRFRGSKYYSEGLNCAKHMDEPDLYDVFAARVTGVIKHFKTDITGLCGFEDAQTTAGGVDVNEIDPKTMMSKLVKGLFFTGEIIDVDGICGGYNLQWAWSTAHVASEHLI